MKNKDARQMILSGEDIEKVRNQYIKDKLEKINYDGIRLADIRQTTEPKFTTLVAELDFCYYVFWQFGESHPFQKWDAQTTKEKSFELFTKLSNELYTGIKVALHDENEIDKKYSDVLSIDEDVETLRKSLTSIKVN